MIIPQRQGVQKEGLAALISDMPSDMVMAEIGCYAGESASMFIESGKVVMLYAVDPWTNTKEAEPVFDYLLQTGKVVKCKGRINDFIDMLPELDMAYIDGDHEYISVKNDILQVLKKLKPGGIIAGHDYSAQYRDMVVRAVHETIGTPDKVYADTSFYKIINK